MGVICGRCNSGKCKFNNKECDGYDFDCKRCNIVYTEQDYNRKLLDMIASIYEEFTNKEIKSKNGLHDRMIICSHKCEELNDYYNIMYMAGIIVLLQNHKFKWFSKSERYEAYKLMKKLKIEIDNRMVRDYNKLKS